MFLKSLKVINIRCFEEAEIDFDLPGGDNRKWTVIVADNGDGKTTILQCIGLIMAGHEAIKSLLTDVDAWIRVGADQARIDAEIETAKGETRAISIVLNRGDTPAAVINRFKTNAEPLNSALDHSTRNYLTLGYGTSRRRSRDEDRVESVSQGFASPRARSIASLFTREIALQPLEPWITGIVDKNKQQIAGLVTDLVAEFLPEIAYHDIEADGSILFKTRDGIVPLHRLSNGHQSLTAFIGDLLFQITNIFRNYKNPLSARGLLLIDSVDGDLHPKLQRRLLAFFETRLKRMQLVVTTQSIVIAQQSPQDALHYCKRTDNGVKVIQFEGEPQKLRLNQLMMTDAFGDTTYESLQVEEMKRRYRELEDRDKLTTAEKREMNKIRLEVGTVPIDDAALGMTEEQMSLLADVKSLLEEQKG